jgi:hypothetical protein
MKCHVLNGLTIEQINEFLAQGYTIADDGSLISPPKQPEAEKPSSNSPSTPTQADTNTNSHSYTYTQSSGCAGILSIDGSAILTLTILAIVAICKRKED